MIAIRKTIVFAIDSISSSAQRTAYKLWFSMSAAFANAPFGYIPCGKQLKCSLKKPRISLATEKQRNSRVGSQELK